MAIICDVTLCALVGWHQCFGGIGCHNLLLWRWRQQIPPKCWSLSMKLCSVSSQKTLILIFNNVGILQNDEMVIIHALHQGSHQFRHSLGQWFWTFASSIRTVQFGENNSCLTIIKTAFLFYELVFSSCVPHICFGFNFVSALFFLFVYFIVSFVPIVFHSGNSSIILMINGNLKETDN
jgi:hypothetical protein